jgi:hypothetical protein
LSGKRWGSEADAVEIGVPIFLTRRDLIRRPVLRHADEAVGNIALREIVEHESLSAQSDIDARHDLLDGAEAISAIDPDVVRPTE